MATFQSVLRYVFLDSLPVANPDELRMVYWSGQDDSRLRATSPQYADRATGRRYHTAFSFVPFQALEAESGLAGFQFVPGLTIRAGAFGPIEAAGMVVTGTFFATVRPAMKLGRPLDESDDSPGAPPVAVITHAFWRGSFAGDAAVVGRPIFVNGAPFVIVGVTSERFHGLSNGAPGTPVIDLILPMAHRPSALPLPSRADERQADLLWIRVIARTLQPSLLEGKLAAAVADTSGAPGSSRADSVRVLLVDGRRGVDIVTKRTERTLAVLGLLSWLVFAIGVANAAALVLLRATSQLAMLRIRSALGASVWNLTTLLLFESAFISVLGSALGSLLALEARPVVARIIESMFDTRSVVIPFDWPSLGFAAFVGSVSTLACGMLPVVLILRRRYLDGAHRRPRSLPRPPGARAVIGFQVALTVPLLTATILMARSVRLIDAAPTGMDLQNVVAFRIRLPNVIDKPTLATVAGQLLEQLRSVPGVAGAALLETPLLTGVSANTFADQNGRQVRLLMNAVTADYFSVTHTPLRSGRSFRSAAGAGPAEVVLNESAARLLFGPESPIGRQLQFGRNTANVVGVVADTIYDDPRHSMLPTAFVQYPRVARTVISAIAGTTRPAAELRPSLAAAVSRVVLDAAITDPQMMREQVAQLTASERLLASLATVSAVFALVLAGIGVFSVGAYAVVRRTHEMGIRAALGANARQIRWLIVRSQLPLTTCALIAGTILSFLLAPLLQAYVYGIAARNPESIVLASLTSGLLAIGGGWLASRRLRAMQPLSALTADS